MFLYNYFFKETQKQARERLMLKFKNKYSNTKNIDFLFSQSIRQGILHTSRVTESVFNDRVASHLFLELFLLYHSTKKINENHTYNWISRYYPNKLKDDNIKEIHDIVLKYSVSRIGCFSS
jgi:hypothetical protein